MFKFIADTAEVNGVEVNDTFSATIKSIIAEETIEGLLNAPRYITYKRGIFVFKLAGFIAQSGNVTLCWEVLNSEFGDRINEVQSVHAGTLAMKF